LHEAATLRKEVATAGISFVFMVKPEYGGRIAEGCAANKEVSEKRLYKHGCAFAESVFIY
jgi:hypothetical protein